MNPSILFQIASTLVLPAWILLIFIPTSKWSEKLVKSGLISLILSVLYASALLLHQWHGSVPGQGFGSLQAVRLLFSSDWALLAGWVHYLAFDLLIAAQIVDAFMGRPILRALILFLIFMFGPFGFLLAKIFLKRKGK